MTPLAALLRTARPADPAADADLLARYRSARDADAFAELVRRHGRLVWAACRHQTRSEADADDCFQAVWLALARNPAAVRDAAKLSAFLHAVAVRVCRKLRAANSRRAARERRCAVADGAVAVPDTAWDRALAAVHEEVAALPEPLRVAFVRCGLEGQGVTEAAAELGWKLGTLSGRLTRAKDVLTKRLDARGLTAGAVTATVCGGAVPAAVAGRTAELVAGAVPASILTLSQGVIVMNRVKLLAAGLLLAGGLGAGVGGGYLASAGAQDRAPAAERPLTTGAAKPEPLPHAPTAGGRWAYYYLSHALPAEGVTRSGFEVLLRDKEAEGWEFVGQVMINWDDQDRSGSGGMGATPRGPLPTAVFRRPVVQPPPPVGNRLLPGTLTISGRINAVADPVTAQRHRIEELEKELAALWAASRTDEARFRQADLPLGVAELKDILARLAAKRFGDDRLGISVERKDGEALVVRGEPARVQWATDLIKALSAPAK